MFRRKSSDRDEYVERVETWIRAAGEFMTDGDPVSSVTAHVALISTLGMAGDPWKAQPLLEVVKVGHALRATVARFAAPNPLPVSGLPVDEIRQLAELPVSDIPSAPGADGIIDALAAHLQPYTELQFEPVILSVEPALWIQTITESLSRLKRNRIKVSVLNGHKLMRLGYVLRALEEALALPPGRG